MSCGNLHLVDRDSHGEDHPEGVARGDRPGVPPLPEQDVRERAVLEVALEEASV